MSAERPRRGQADPRGGGAAGPAQPVSFKGAVLVTTVMDKLRRGVVKTIQAAAEHEVFDSLPDCDEIATTDKLGIKLLHSYSDDESPSVSTLSQISLVVSDRRGAGRCLFKGEMVPGIGIVLRTHGGTTVMSVRLPETSKSSIGKIVHPAGATIYKVEFDKNLPFGNEWTMTKNGEPFANLVATPLETVFGPLKWLMRCCSCINSDYSVDFFKLDNEEIGYLRPSICTSTHSVVLKFSDEQNSTVQERAAMLGASILFLIVTIYPEYGEALQASMRSL